MSIYSKSIRVLKKNQILFLFLVLFCFDSIQAQIVLDPKQYNANAIIAAKQFNQTLQILDTDSGSGLTYTTVTADPFIKVYVDNDAPPICMV